MIRVFPIELSEKVDNWIVSGYGEEGLCPARS